MKNKQIVDSWNKIEQDSAADERMLSAILNRNRAEQSRKRKGGFMNKTSGRKRLVPVAVCLVMVIAAAAVFANNAGWFGGEAYTQELSGGTLSFYKSDGSEAGSIDFGLEAAGRNLTTEETVILFGDLDVSSYGLFSLEDGTLLHLEGRTGSTKVILAALGLPTADWKHSGIEESSEIDGIQVNAGYFTTDKNSQGVKNIIFYASFALNDVSVYVECGGNLDERDAWQAEIAKVIDTLIKNGAPSISELTW